MSAPNPPALAGRMILVTRAENKGDDFSRALEALGAAVLSLPVIRIEDPPSWEPLTNALARLESFQWLVFTSATAVERFGARWRESRRGGRLPPSVRVAAVGPRTSAALRAEGIEAHRVAADFRAEGLLECLPGESVRGMRVLFPRAQEARELLVEELMRRGASVEVVPVYRTVPAGESRESLQRVLREGKVDVVTFASASAVKAFIDLAGEEGMRNLQSARIACLGEVTAGAARQAGMAPDIIPSRGTLADLAEAIAAHFAPRPTGPEPL